MSGQGQWCAPCLARWTKLPVAERRKTKVNRWRTVVNGTRVCPDCALDMLDAEAREIGDGKVGR